MLATVAAADSAKVQKKSTEVLYIAKRNHTLCTLYINRCVNCVFYSITVVKMVYGKMSARSQQVSHEAVVPSETGLVRYLLASRRHLAVYHIHNKDI